jgi:hypothetical protein
MVVLALGTPFVGIVGKDWIGAKPDASFVVDSRFARWASKDAATSRDTDFIGIDELFCPYVKRRTHFRKH